MEELGFYLFLWQANFLLAKYSLGSTQYLYQSLKEWGILIRYFNQWTLEDKLRITVGTR